MHALHLLYALLAPELLKSLSTSVGRGTYGLVLKWERRESINIRVMKTSHKSDKAHKEDPQRGQRIQKELTQERRQRRLSGTVCIIPLL